MTKCLSFLGRLTVIFPSLFNLHSRSLAQLGSWKLLCESNHFCMRNVFLLLVQYIAVIRCGGKKRSWDISHFWCHLHRIHQTISQTFLPQPFANIMSPNTKQTFHRAIEGPSFNMDHSLFFNNSKQSRRIIAELLNIQHHGEGRILGRICATVFHANISHQCYFRQTSYFRSVNWEEPVKKSTSTIDSCIHLSNKWHVLGRGSHAQTMWDFN